MWSGGCSGLLLALLVLLGALLLAPIPCHGLSCPPCEDRLQTCGPPKKCAFGRVKDQCGCCSICGNGPGEKCGGEFLIMGQCGKGLECRSNHASFFPEFDVGVCVRKQPHVRRTNNNKFSTPPQPSPGLKHVRLNPPGSELNKPPPKQLVLYPQYANSEPQQDKPPRKQNLYNPVPGKQRLYLVPKPINHRLFQYTAATVKPNAKIYPTPTASIK